MRVRSIAVAKAVAADRSDIRAEVLGAVGAALFGGFILFIVGFAGASALHEAAHNTRHSISFPCH